MTIRAYAEEYLNDAMNNLGEAFDYAVNACHIEMQTFMDLFVTSGFADAFGNGSPKIVAGMTGTELVMEILTKVGLERDFPEPQERYDFNAEYWCGWILAYYQWKTNRSFKDINELVSMQEILKLYPTLHEASEEKFVDTLNSIIKRKMITTRLQARRKQCGLSQKKLSDESGVNLRTLQQYEVGAKDINKASVTNLLALAKVLSCDVEDLLEYNESETEE